MGGTLWEGRDDAKHYLPGPRTRISKTGLPALLRSRLFVCSPPSHTLSSTIHRTVSPPFRESFCPLINYTRAVRAVVVPRDYLKGSRPQLTGGCERGRNLNKWIARERYTECFVAVTLHPKICIFDANLSNSHPSLVLALPLWAKLGCKDGQR